MKQSQSSVGAANKVPFDVWLHIARFIHRETLVNLGLVNYHLYNIATKARYDSVVISNFDKRIKKLCQDIRDPDTRHGRLVRKFTVRPWYEEPQFGLPQNRIPGQKPFQRFLGAVSDYVNPDSVQVRIHKQVMKRVHKGIKSVSKAVRGMSQLHEYEITWREGSPYHPELYEALVGPALNQVASHLIVLKLNVPTEMLRNLYLIDLPRLEHLEVDICTMEFSEQTINLYFDAFIVFVNNLNRTLNTLSIASRVPSRHLDLVRFFTSLGTFPKLHTFSLSIPFDGRHLTDPRLLTAFLRKHSAHLQYLHLKATRCETVHSPSDPAFKYWVPNILSGGVHYPGLRGLRLALRPLKADLVPIHKFLALHATLTSLTLTDRALELHDVTAILRCIEADEVFNACQLAELKMRVRRLTPALMTQFAQRLPQLQVLELTFDEIRATATHVGGNGTPVRLPKEEFGLFAKTINDNRSRFARWNLVTLGLSQVRINPHPELGRLFMECIPALQDVIELPPVSLF